MNKIFQKEFSLVPRSRGFHLITDEIVDNIPELSEITVGILYIFIKHTSASLTINENADSTVRADFMTHFNSMVPEGKSSYKHNSEGPDDMPAHLKTALLDTSLQIPITSGRLNLGTWQGIYLCEHRNKGGSRKLILTAIGN
ncbi:secondary thiamine-phosphate synthase enzyme YjbQ [Gillisia marina]|uniref:secondary thiamine-phosphate synthase enzyme YjbQ n=1 Tax=Gillisia marina TaxID=1167637 RepID=UPI00029A1339|nr:secondary thiamine-phosphate synthase enzyme YjbQ [Gillisia marina]